MLSSLIRIATDIGAGVAADSVGEAATSIQVRKPYFGGASTPYVYPNQNTGDQLDAYRGTVYAAVDKIARRVCQVQVRLYQFEHDLVENEVEETELRFHPFLTIFSSQNGRKPHEEYSNWELTYTHQASLDTTGESWWLTERDDLGRPARITPLPSNRMTIVIDKDSGLTAGYFFTPKGSTERTGGIFIPKRSWKYLHDNPTEPFITFFRYPSPKGIEDARGWSPIKAAAFAYDINLYESIYKRNFLAQGAQLGGILQSEVALNKDQIEDYLDQFKNRHSGVNKAGIPMVLPKMLKWTTTEPTPRDLQWVEAMKLTEGQILQTYGISDAKLGRADIGNRNTADAMDVTFNREVIQSRLDVNISKLNTDFLPIYPGQTDQLYFTARYDDPVPADGEANLKREMQDITNGVVTRNELRVQRKLKPFGKFGDQVYMSIANLPVDPWDVTKLEISQDDADKLGYISPEDQASIDAEQAKLAASLAPKDEKPVDKPKADAKKGSSSFGRSLQRSDTADDKALEAIVAYLLSEAALEEFRSYVDGLIATLIADEVDIARKLVGSEVAVDASVIAAEFERTLTTRITGINETTANLIREAVANGLEAGESLDQIVARISSLFEQRWRAMMIARTEVLGASNYAASETYRQSGVPKKGWGATLDNVTRDTHASAHGQVVDMDKPFDVGGYEMMYPGDPSAPADQVINCRCIVRPETSDRSIWADANYKALWDAFEARSVRYEQLIADAVGVAFQTQKARVISIINQIAK